MGTGGRQPGSDHAAAAGADADRGHRAHEAPGRGCAVHRVQGLGMVQHRAGIAEPEHGDAAQPGARQRHRAGRLHHHRELQRGRRQYAAEAGVLRYGQVSAGIPQLARRPPDGGRFALRVLLCWDTDGLPVCYPLPLAGEGPGERAGVGKSEGLDFADASALSRNGRGSAPAVCPG
ncbi:hypothetical protein CBM2608_B20050 [Cupriavidus taiwanensis]|nr:hypothetical protein CBM2608_B20050 [Cupriavidus taiwanensis]